METSSLLDLIYHYIVAFDNDRITLGQRQEIVEKLKHYTKGKIPIHHFVHQCLDTVRERDTIKEIGNLIMMNMEEENLFYDDYIASKEKLNYYNCIFIPSLKLKDARIIL